MHNRFALIFTLLLGWNAFAQSAGDHSTINETSTTRSDVDLHRSLFGGLSVFAAGYLGDPQNVGNGFGLEYQFSRYFAVFGFVSHFSTQAGPGDSLWGPIAGQDTQTTNNFAEVGLKYFPVHWWIGAPFVAVSYQRGTTNVNIIPGVFGGPSESVDLPYEGASVATGFRFYSIKNSVFTFLIDAGVKYAPGMLSDSHYVIDSADFSGVHSAHVEASLHYDFVPTVQLGMQF